MATTKTKEKLAWVAIDPTTLSPKAQAAHKVLRDHFEATSKAKAAFEALANAEIFGASGVPAGKEAAYAYRRGIAIALATAKGASTSQAAGAVSAIAAKLGATAAPVAA